MDPILDVRSLTVELPTTSGWIRPVNDVSFTLNQGETLGIVGESGSGKTMLSLALMGLEPHGARHSGEAWLATKTGNQNILASSADELRAIRGRDIAMIFQEPMTALNPVLRVGEQVAEAIRVHEPGASEKEIQSRVLQSLERAALPDPQRRAQPKSHGDRRVPDVRARHMHLSPGDIRDLRRFRLRGFVSPIS